SDPNDFSRGTPHRRETLEA
ncbi:unnamed protein product, partial [Rotaria socialis]